MAPADPLHGSRHLQLSALIDAHIGPEFEAACDLLIRSSEIDDIAPDVSVYPEAPDPETGSRQIEQLAFELVSTQSLSKAAKLVGRGVRRVFAIDVERSLALEWSATLVLTLDGARASMGSSINTDPTDRRSRVPWCPSRNPLQWGRR